MLLIIRVDCFSKLRKINIQGTNQGNEAGAKGFFQCVSELKGASVGPGAEILSLAVAPVLFI